MTTMTIVTPDEGRPGLGAEEHDFDEMYPPPVPSSVTRAAEAGPTDEDDEDEDTNEGDWID